MLTGDTTDRATPVRQFQAGKVPLFLVSLKAGGIGLNLTAADTVIHYDPWWNPAVENQATDRAHRIGQDKPVFVYKLIVEEGIETAIELLKARKAALAEALFAGGAKTPLDLTEADISALFAPLDRKPERRRHSGGLPPARDSRWRASPSPHRSSRWGEGRGEGPVPAPAAPTILRRARGSRPTAGALGA